MKNTDIFFNNLEEFKIFSEAVNVYISSLSLNKYDKQFVDGTINNLNYIIDAYVYRYPNNLMIKEMAVDLKRIYIRALSDIS